VLNGSPYNGPVPTALRALVCLTVVLAAAPAQDYVVPEPAAGSDWYGDWMMWWSTNREEFLCRTDPATTSRPADLAPMKPVTMELTRTKIVPVLQGALKDGERLIREAAAIALGLCGDAMDVKSLLPLANDRDRSVAESAILGLGMLGAEEADEALAKMLADVSLPERRHGFVSIALGLSGADPTAKQLFENFGWGKQERLESCRILGACLWSGGDLGGTRPDRCTLASSQTQKSLKAQDKRRKLLALGTAALSKARDPGSKAYILQAMRDPRFDVRAAAAIAAGRVIKPDDKEGVKALSHALDAEPHTLPTRFLVIALGRVGGPELASKLSKEYGTGDKVRRAFTALALGMAGATDVSGRLRQDVLGATEDRLKGAYVIALGLLKDPDAFAAVSQIAQGRTNDELLSYCAWFFALAQNLKAVPILERILGQSRDFPAQEAAASALGILGSVESQRALTAILTGNGPESGRKAAAIGLGRMRDERAVDALLRVAKGGESPFVRAAAISALGSVARRTNMHPLARVAIDAYYGLQNEAIDDVATIVGSLMKTTEEGGGQTVK
jgi:HEAT repeat protein